MKKVLLIIAGVLLISGSVFNVTLAANAMESQDEKTPTVDVIAYFTKRDTLDYLIQEGQWKFNGKDTVKIAGISTKVRLVVTDSTAKGYKMALSLSNDIVGTTLKFETDELVEGYISE